MIEAQAASDLKYSQKTLKILNWQNFTETNDLRSRSLHYFLGFAQNTDNVDVDKRWQQWIDFETSIIVNYGKMKLYTDSESK
jgi:tRNA-(ms[2]io[6]A)-hydroxylase